MAAVGQAEAVYQRPHPGRVARAGAATALDRGQATAARDQQARGRLSAHTEVHGARVALCTAAGREDRPSRWARTLQARRGTNVAVVALANKNARIAWALLRRGEPWPRPERPPLAWPGPPADPVCMESIDSDGTNGTAGLTENLNPS